VRGAGSLGGVTCLGCLMGAIKKSETGQPTAFAIRSKFLTVGLPTITLDNAGLEIFNLLATIVMVNPFSFIASFILIYFLFTKVYFFYDISKKREKKDKFYIIDFQLFKCNYVTS
jgi:Na+/H+ antiporter NhaD/arsenite permease-like protein